MGLSTDPSLAFLVPPPCQALAQPIWVPTEGPTNRLLGKYHETLTNFQLPPCLRSTEDSRVRAWTPGWVSEHPRRPHPGRLFFSHPRLFCLSLSALSLSPLLSTSTCYRYIFLCCIPLPIWASVLLLFRSRVKSPNSCRMSEKDWRATASPKLSLEPSPETKDSF